MGCSISAPLVVARNLSRSFRSGDSSVSAVKEVNLVIEQGEFLGLSGPSGCGKSTLLNMLGLVEAPSSGELLFNSVDVANANERQCEALRRNTIGYVFQAFNLLSTLTVEENVALPCVLVGLSKDQARARALELLSSLGLSQRVSALPAMLSGGEMQRVAIARAISHKPKLILADEPTGNLDSVAGDAVLSLLSDINSQGVTIIMATHSDTALKRCSRIIRMRDGELVSG
jgi:putative ABC transport system ATP-binding protein